MQAKPTSLETRSPAHRRGQGPTSPPDRSPVCGHSGRKLRRIARQHRHPALPAPTRGSMWQKLSTSQHPKNPVPPVTNSRSPRISSHSPCVCSETWSEVNLCQSAWLRSSLLTSAPANRGSTWATVASSVSGVMRMQSGFRFHAARTPSPPGSKSFGNKSALGPMCTINAAGPDALNNSRNVASPSNPGLIRIDGMSYARNKCSHFGIPNPGLRYRSRRSCLLK